jgi:hypothetical protein
MYIKMNTMIDKRKTPLSQERLDKLAMAREKAIEKRRQNKEEHLRLDEEEAKNEILAQPEPEETVEPDTEPKVPEPRKKSAWKPQQSFSLSEDDIGYVKEFVQTAKEKKKAEKWRMRKEEILQDVLGYFNVKEEPEYEDEKPPKNTSVISLFDEY